MMLLATTTGVDRATITPDGDATADGPDLFRADTWAPLDAAVRLHLFLAAAVFGELGADFTELIPAARLMEAGEFTYGTALVRGVSAAEEIPADSVLGTVSDDGALISLQSLVRRLSRHSDDPLLRLELDSVVTSDLVASPADERALFALLLMREQSRASSPIMPYLATFLQQEQYEHVPAAWNPHTESGAARRAGLHGLENGPVLLQAADEMRRVITQEYAALVPRALERLPRLFGVTGPDRLSGGDEAVAAFYSFQRFAEIWLAVRARSYSYDDGAVLVPLGCAMNHPAEGESANVAIQVVKDGVVLRSTRQILQGEQLTYSYRLCAERALLVYGFPVSVWSTMTPCEGF